MAVPLVLVIVVTVTVVVSLVVCQIKRAKNITEERSNNYTDNLHGLEVNEAYETNVITKVNMAYSSSRDFEQNKAHPSNMDLQHNETYTSTEDLLDSAQSEEAYASIVELEPYATVTTLTQGNGENKDYGSSIVREENEASKLEIKISNGAVNEYADYHAYDSI